MISYYFKTAKDEKFTKLSEPKDGCWIHVDEATVHDLPTICQLTGLEQADLQDCLDKYEVPRIERVKNYLLIFTRYPSEQETGLYTSTLTIVIGGHYFFTISPHKSLLIEQFLEKRFKFSTLQKSKLLLYLILTITQEFTLQIRRVRQSIVQQEKKVRNVESEDITALTKSEEVLNQYLSSLTRIRHVLDVMTTGKYALFNEKDHELVEDLLNAVKQSEDLCAIVLKSIRGLRESYQIIFTNSLHKTIKLLTSLTIIFSIPTMIASLYGMNVLLPLAKSTHAFAFIMLIIVFLSLLGLYLFKLKRWL